MYQSTHYHYGMYSTIQPTDLRGGDPAFLSPPAVGHPGRQGRPLQGPAAVLSRAVRRGLG